MLTHVRAIKELFLIIKIWQIRNHDSIIWLIFHVVNNFLIDVGLLLVVKYFFPEYTSVEKFLSYRRFHTN